MIRRLIILLLIVGCATEHEDCIGVAGGTAVEDDCGVCDGIDGYVAGSCYDCANTSNGNAVLDNCGACDSDATNDCTADCNGDWGGDATIDACDVCGGEITNESDCLQIQCDLDVCISIQNVDLSTNILEVWMMNNIPVAGFQFNISGVTIISASGGSAQSNGMSPSISEHIVLGFSFSGNSIPSGNSILTHIGFSEYNGSICLSDPVFSNNSGVALSVESETALISLSER